MIGVSITFQYDEDFIHAAWSQLRRRPPESSRACPAEVQGLRHRRRAPHARRISMSGNRRNAARSSSRRELRKGVDRPVPASHPRSTSSRSLSSLTTPARRNKTDRADSSLLHSMVAVAQTPGGLAGSVPKGGPRKQQVVPSCATCRSATLRRSASLAPTSAGVQRLCRSDFVQQPPTQSESQHSQPSCDFRSGGVPLPAITVPA